MSVDKEKFREACEILREGISITEYLENEGHVSYELDETNKMIKCPFPDHDDGTPSFSYNLDKKLFNCFGCDRGGDIINLHYYMMKLENERYTRIKAVKDLSKEYGIKIPNLYRTELKTGIVNKYTKKDVDLNNLKEEFYKEKIKGYEVVIKGLDDDKRIKLYRWIDDMYLGRRYAKEVFEKIRGELI